MSSESSSASATQNAKGQQQQQVSALSNFSSPPLTNNELGPPDESNQRNIATSNSPPKHPYSTKWQLFYLVTILGITLVLYLDRGIIAAILPDISQYFPQLHSFEEGLLASSFLFGYMVSSLFFAEMANCVPMKLILLFGCISFIGTNVLVSLGLTVVAPLVKDQNLELFGGIELDLTPHSRVWYYFLVVGRLGMSIGEAAIIPISYTVLDDLMSHSLRTISVTLLSLMLPVGIAAGFAASGLFHWIFSEKQWYNVFWLEALLMVLISLPLLLFPIRTSEVRKKNLKRDVIELQDETVPHNTTKHIELEEDVTVDLNRDVNLGVTSEATNEEQDIHSENHAPSESDDSVYEDVNINEELPWENMVNDDVLATAIRQHYLEEDLRKYHSLSALLHLITNPRYIFVSLAGILYTFVLGSVMFWGPSFIVEYLDMEVSDVDLLFSLVALFGGVLGPLGSGLLLTKLVSSKGAEAHKKRKKTLWSFIVSTICLFVGFSVALVGFVLPPNRYVFFGTVGTGMLFLLGAQTPLNLILISSVPMGVRTFSMSLFIFLIHLFGDFPSPLIFGVLKDWTSSLWSMRIFWILLLFAVLSYGMGAVFAWKELRRYRNHVKSPK